jgi:hypothetical protein
MNMRQRSDQISGGIFLIGLAVLAVLNYWWPGIMFVIGASLIARDVATGKDWENATPGLVAIGVGLIFALQATFQFTNILPLILIGLGLALLFGRNIIKRS